MDQSFGKLPARGIGVVVPRDFALDHELWRWASPDVCLHLTRPVHDQQPVTVEMVETVNDVDQAVDAVRSILATEPKALAYGCTAGSFNPWPRG